MATPHRILGRTRRLTTANRRVFDEIFESGGGRVLDFGIATMTEWFEEVVGIVIFVPKYQRDGASKGRTLRGFVEVADGALVAFALQELWQYRATATSDEPRSETRDAELKQWLDQFCQELSQLSDADVSAALVDFSADESLPLLRANIHRGLLDGNPHVAIDRIHTFATKRLRHALGERKSSFDNRTPLHSLLGVYMKDVKDSGQLKDFMWRRCEASTAFWKRSILRATSIRWRMIQCCSIGSALSHRIRDRDPRLCRSDRGGCELED